MNKYIEINKRIVNLRFLRAIVNDDWGKYKTTLILSPYCYYTDIDVYSESKKDRDKFYLTLVNFLADKRRTIISIGNYSDGSSSHDLDGENLITYK